MRRRPSLESIITLVVVAASALFVFAALHPSKLFLNTTPAGGDMGAHVWAPQFLRHHLFPHGRISGWSQDWYAGFPALTFYFPLPYLVIALLSYVLPYGVAFKLVSVSGVIGLPVAAWAMGRMLRMRFPGPALLAIATLPYLFDRYWTIWGGNIASTLAGEFSFSIGLALALVFLGVFFQVLETGQHKALAAVLLAATVLCHILPAMFAIGGALILVVLTRPSIRGVRTGLVVGVLAGAIAAWWLLPFAARLGYSNNMGWERTSTYLKGLFPWLSKSALDSANAIPAIYTRHLKIVSALAAAGALGGLGLRRRASVFLTLLALGTAIAFRLMPQGALWNGRMLPFWYLCLYLIAAAGLAEAAVALAILFGRTRASVEPEVRASPDAETTREPALVGAAVGMVSDAVQEPAADPASAGSGDPAGAGGGDPAGAGGGDPAGAGGGGTDPGQAGGAEGSRESPDAAITPSRVPPIVVLAAAFLVVWLFVGQPIGAIPSWFPLRFRGAATNDKSFVPEWADWNYSGYQRKASYPEYRNLVSTMARVGKTYGCGRAMWEYESEEDRFGTPMALMLLPMWTNGCIGSMEGLYFESSATVPYHFLNQAELSETPSEAMRNLPYRSLDVADGIAHLRLMGVRYYMAISPRAQAEARRVPGLTLVATTQDHPVTYDSNGQYSTEQRHWEIYEISDSATVTPLAFQPVVMTDVSTTARGWIDLAVPWFQEPGRWNVMLAASGPPSWKRVRGADPNPPLTPVRPAVVSNIKTTDDRISFDVDRPGSPVLVKTSYFPNWQAIGAGGPWRVTPNLMVVIPTTTHVELHYGFTPADNAGRLLTLGGLAVAVWWWRRERQSARQAGSEPAAPGAV